MNPAATPARRGQVPVDGARTDSPRRDPMALGPAVLGNERWLRIGGTVIGVLLGFVTGVWEVFLSPLYWGGVPIPLAPVLAVATTVGLVWFTRTVTGRTGPALLPGLAWMVVMVLAADQRTEGDLLIPVSNVMGLITLLAGALAWGIGAYRMMLKSSQPR